MSLLISLFMWSCHSIPHDSVREAKLASNNSMHINHEISHFLIEAIDAHRFTLAQGLAAEEQGMTDEVRKTAALIVQEQIILLNQLITIANCRKVKLPEELSNSKARQLKTLTTKQGIDFDRRYIKMLVGEYKLYRREFEKGMTLNDRYVRAFTRYYMPVIENRIVEIEGLKIDENMPRSILVANN
jgi:putative membrane protein